ncbi:hypothetical protein Cgig2_007147 [Carnegiea gigantea]|uniref:DUF4283 domain-containing protein n=1 Tax=Carnegiea gigantea TaxID=171969 RepID=A0A9Q1KMW4_9CARY|nr:hypothetical protein Cgig2_007147 [Carnegiea gigantea]
MAGGRRGRPGKIKPGRSPSSPAPAPESPGNGTASPSKAIEARASSSTQILDLQQVAQTPNVSRSPAQIVPDFQAGGVSAPQQHISTSGPQAFAASNDGELVPIPNLQAVHQASESSPLQQLPLPLSTASPAGAFQQAKQGTSRPGSPTVNAASLQTLTPVRCSPAARPTASALTIAELNQPEQPSFRVVQPQGVQGSADESTVQPRNRPSIESTNAPEHNHSILAQPSNIPLGQGENITSSTQFASSPRHNPEPDQNLSNLHGDSKVHLPNWSTPVKLVKSNVEVEIQYWQSAVLCKVMGANPPFEVMKGFINRIWANFTIDRILYVRKGVFLVRFANLQDKMAVEKWGVYFFDNKPMLVKGWNPSMDI